jgi:hypothetical protein
MDMLYLQTCPKKEIKRASERNQKSVLNLSGFYTAIIKEAAKCSSYSSDVLYDIDSIKDMLKNMKDGEQTRYYLGFRNMGVDAASFIREREPSEYRKIYKMVATMLGGYITVSLYDLKFK